MNAFRLLPDNWTNEKTLSDIVSLFKKYNGVCDEIALFTSDFHTPLNIKSIDDLIIPLKNTIKYIKKSGFSCGINILATIGHHNENLDNMYNVDAQRMTNIFGEICQGSYCMNTKEIKLYITELYSKISSCEPDFIWIDDDIRYGHMPIGFGCFCDNCIDLFNREFGYDFTREELRNHLNNGNVEIRKNWLDKQKNSINMIFQLIRKVVPTNIDLGFMTGERFFEGYDFSTWADTLSNKGDFNIKWRPGGSAYTDMVPKEFITKSDEIGRQVSLLPQYVKIIQSEIENFPYQLLKKSPKITAFEAALYITSGCTATAFNIIPFTLKNTSYIENHIKEIYKYTPYYEELSKQFGRKNLLGINTCWTKYSQAATPAGEWVKTYGDIYGNFADEIFENGFPCAYSPDHANLFFMSGESAKVMSDSEILHILSKALYLDAVALKTLTDMGYGKYLGFTVDKFDNSDCIEEYTDHPINQGFSGDRRNCRQAFNKGLSAALIPQPRADILSKIVDYCGNEKYACTMGLYKNSLGGTICVGGYYPFSWISDNSKLTQLKRLFLYMTNNNLIAYIKSYHRAYLKTTGESICIINTNLEEITDVEVCIKTDHNKAILSAAEGTEISILGNKTDNGYMIYKIPSIQSWNMVLLKIKT